MNISSALTEYEHALEIACANPNDQNVGRFDRASCVYAGVVKARIENLRWIAAAGVAAIATSYLFTGFPNTTVLVILLAWVAGMHVPIALTVGHKRTVLNAVDGWHVVFANWNRPRPDHC